MNCEKCLAQLDDLLDLNLSSSDCAAMEAHLENCESCAAFQADFAAILETCHEAHEYTVEPPNSQALWLRINNLIESEQTTLVAAESKNVVNVVPQNGWWSRGWQLSFQQMTAAVVGVAVIASLLTVVGLQNSGQIQSGFAAQFSNLPKMPAPRGIEIENRLKQQQVAIQYWNQRVETRKNQWNRNLRDAFDRNLQVIDQVVADYQQQLQFDPNDKISEEMLDAALSDKMELLREFSEL